MPNYLQPAPLDMPLLTATWHALQFFWHRLLVTSAPQFATIFLELLVSFAETAAIQRQTAIAPICL
jgi:hypothetical protein